MADIDKYGRRVGNTLKDIAPGPMFNDWYASPTRNGSVIVQPGNELRDLKAHDFFTSGGGGGYREFLRPFDSRFDVFQHHEDVPLDELDLQNAIRDRMMRGQ